MNNDEREGHIADSQVGGTEATDSQMGEEFVGTTIHERYLVDKRIQRGGSAVVLRALDLAHDTPRNLEHPQHLALKVFFPLSVSRSRSIGMTNEERFQRSGLPHVLRVFDRVECTWRGGDGEGLPTIALIMEWGEESLEEQINKGGVTRHEAYEWALGCALGLHAAHNHKPRPILHNDVKAANLISVAGEKKLSDFGIALELPDGYTHDYQSVGSKPIAPPEWHTGKERRSEGDIYMLGLVLRQTLTLGGRLTDSAPNPPLSDRDNRLIGRLCHIDPGERPDAAESVKLLTTALNREEPVGALRVASPDRGTRPTHRASSREALSPGGRRSRRRQTEKPRVVQGKDERLPPKDAGSPQPFAMSSSHAPIVQEKQADSPSSPDADPGAFSRSAAHVGSAQKREHRRKRRRRVAMTVGMSFALLIGVAVGFHSFNANKINRNRGEPHLGMGASTPATSTPTTQPDIRATVAPTDSYRIVDSKGDVYSFGNAPDLGSWSDPPAPVVGITTDPAPGNGYYLLANDGTVQSFNQASTPSIGQVSVAGADPAVGIATPDSGGYWIAQSDGYTAVYGDAETISPDDPYTPGEPFVGIAGWGQTFVELGRNGYVLCFPEGMPYCNGDNAASADGGAAAIAASPKGGFYYVDANGGVWCDGAPFYGALNSDPPPAPVVGIAVTQDGGGYWLVTSAGAIYAFGDATPYGNVKSPGAAIVGIAEA